jgi:purine nucleosidase/pyrimidine-specific ribonucleoside hydrolase
MNPENSMPIDILLDTDIGDDIDDAWALAVCLRHPNLRLIGVATVLRDTELRAAQARLLLELAEASRVPVAAGARDPLDSIHRITRNNQADVLSSGDEERLRRGRTDGVRFLAEMARAHPGVTLLPVGPLTNIARLILEFPDDFAKVGRIVMMGGHMIPGRDEPEYNVTVDPRATRIVFGCGKPITMIGLDVTLQCVLTAGDLMAVGAKETPLTRALIQMTELWQKEGRKPDDTSPLRMPCVHDPLAALVAADPSFVTLESRTVAADDRGRCLASAGRPNIDVAVAVQPERVRQALVDLIQ